MGNRKQLRLPAPIESDDDEDDNNNNGDDRHNADDVVGTAEAAPVPLGATGVWDHVDDVDNDKAMDVEDDDNYPLATGVPLGRVAMSLSESPPPEKKFRSVDSDLVEMLDQDIIAKRPNVHFDDIAGNLWVKGGSQVLYNLFN